MRFSLYKFLLGSITLLFAHFAQGKDLDTTRISRILNQFEGHRDISQPALDSAIVAYELAQGLHGNLELTDKAALNLSLQYYYRGKLDSAMNLLIPLHRKYGTKPSSHIKGKVLHRMGVLEERKRNYVEGLELFLEGIEVYKEVEDTLGVADCYNSIGIIHHYQDNFELAVEYYHRADSLYSLLSLPLKLGVIHNNMGALFNSRGFHDSALHHLKLALHFRMSVGDVPGTRSTLHNLGTTFGKKAEDNKNMLDSAQAYYKKALDLYLQTEPTNPHVFSTYNTLAKTFYEMDQYDSCKRYATLALEGSLLYRIPRSASVAYSLLASTNEVQGNLSLALKQLRLSADWRDTMTRELHDQRVEDLTAQFMLKEAEEENRYLKEQDELRASNLEYKDQINLLLSFGVGLLGILLVLMIYNRFQLIQKRKELQSAQNDLNERNEQLSELVADKNEMIGMLAHDIRSPFNKVVSLVEILRMEEDESQKAEVLNLIEGMSKDGLMLIQDMIDLSRVDEVDETGKREDLRDSVNVSELLRRLKEGFSSTIQVKNLNFILDLPARSIEIEVRKDFLERILDNLISNAIKFSPKGTQIAVSAEVIDGKTIIEVKDSGPGFLKTDLEKLFHKFQKLSAQPTGQEASTGLGLYIANRLAKAIGADIKLASDPGESARFQLILPSKF